MSEVMLRINALERRLEEIHTRLDETENRTSDHNKQLAVLNTKLDEIRSTLKDLKAFPDNFVSRQEMQVRLDAAQQQLTMLSAAVAENQRNHLDVLKSMHGNTIATYGTLLATIMGLIGLFATFLTADFGGKGNPAQPESKVESTRPK
jgi:chromosome segregation ATPase